jgi:two-component system response regulator GlrR
VCEADVRVIGSTNVELAALAARGEYRLDLIFRLNVLGLELPPLRSRGDDAIMLACAFVDRLSRRYGRPAKRLTATAIEHLRAHDWPGNVRELENLIHREFLLSDGPEIGLPAVTPLDRPRHRRDERNSRLTATSFREAKARAIADFERAYLGELLARAHGNVSLAARLAGKERSRLDKLIRKHGFSRAEFRAARSDPNGA